MSGATVVITGASSGIGREFARIFAKKGNTLILCARRKKRLYRLKQKLEQKTKVTCEIVTLDVSKEEECYRLCDSLKDRKIDVFINNAGFGECGAFCEIPLEKETDMIHVNIRAVHIFTKQMLQKMKQQGHGYLLNVASSAGLFPAGPFMATYYATKSYVVSLTKAAAEELRQEHSNVYIGALCPGPVNTEFNQVANVEFALSGISAKQCVKEAVFGMKKRKVIIVPTFLMKLAVLAGSYMPDRVLLPILAHQQKSKKAGKI